MLYFTGVALYRLLHARITVFLFQQGCFWVRAVNVLTTAVHVQRRDDLAQPPPERARAWSPARPRALLTALKAMTLFQFSPSGHVLLYFSFSLSPHFGALLAFSQIKVEVWSHMFQVSGTL